MFVIVCFTLIRNMEISLMVLALNLFSVWREGGSSVFPSWLHATLWQTDEFSHSAPPYEYASIDRLASCPCTTVVQTRKARGRVVFENNGKTLWSCADRSVSSNSCHVVYFACLCGRSYLASGERSVPWYVFRSRSVFCFDLVVHLLHRGYVVLATDRNTKCSH